MNTRKELEQAGYRKIAQTHGGVAQATFYNPSTEDSFTLIVDDVDDYGKFNYGLYHMPVDENARKIYDRKHGIIEVGDTVEVFKGRKIPRGTIAVVVRKYDWCDCYGRVQARYGVFGIVDGQVKQVKRLTSAMSFNRMDYANARKFADLCENMYPEYRFEVREHVRLFRKWD